MAGNWFYPHGGPNEYSYTSNFYNKFGKTGSQAKSNTSEKIFSANYNSIEGAGIANLQSMINTARAAEMAFLSKYNFGEVNSKNWSDLFKAFNLILQTEESFNRNLRYIEQINNSKDEEDKWRTMESYFSSYLETTIRRMIGQNPNVNIDDAFLERAINNALKNMSNKMYDYVDVNGKLHTTKKQAGGEKVEQIQAFTKMLELLRQFRTNVFLSGIKELFALEKFANDAKNDALNNRKGKKRQAKIRSSIENSYAKGGVTEYFMGQLGAILINQLKGGNNTFKYEASANINEMKTDMFETNLAEGTITITDMFEDNLDTKYSKSVRAQNIQAFRNVFDKLKKAKGEILQINAKNYNIVPNFRGFRAQDTTSLENIDELFQETQIVDREGLVNYLANCGPDMIQGQPRQELTTAIATNIGHFLFDDLSIQIPEGITNVHVFYLSGMYLPLSVFLEATLQAILSSKSVIIEQFVHVNFTIPSGENDAKNQGPWTSSVPFENFRNNRLQQTKISVKFLSGFSNFITSLAQSKI